MSSTGVVLQPPIKTNHPNHKSQMKNTNNNTNNNHNNSNNNSNNNSSNNNNNSSTNGNTAKRKSKHDRNGRKRSKSFSGCNINKMLCQKSVPPTKFLLGGNITDPLNLNSLQNEEINRAMNAITPKSSPIPTPPRRKGQIEVIIPPNIHDPLNLIDCADDAEYEQQLYSPIKRGRKKRLKKRRTVSACLENLDSVDSILPISIAKTPETSTDSAKIPDEIPSIIISKIDNIKRDLNLDLSPKKRKFEQNEYCANDGGGGGDTSINNTDNENKSTTIETTPPPITTLISTNTTTITCNITTATTTITTTTTTTTNTAPSITTNSTNSAKKFKHSMDKIVSPVVPQPGAWLKRSTSTSKPKPRRNKMVNEKLPVFKEKDKQFQYGNYNRYYGYRNAHIDIDHRLRIFSQHRYLFEGKDILDIGCNIGHITLSVARDFGAKSVTGIDIDPKLIAIARKNVKHYVKNTPSPKTGDDVNNQDDGNNKDKSSEFFPISMPILYGPIDIPGFNDNYTRRDFPNNVIFKKCNYILEDDALLALEQPQYDAILCLSITKWIHLNWGDVGLKQAFRRMYAQLRPGGKLILEPQNWSSYKSKRKLTETIYKNYNSIEFFPDKFTEYLLSSVVGFAKSEILGYPNHNAKGFRRPIQIFTKSTMFLSERIEASATPNINLSTHYDVEMKTEKYESQTQIELEKSEHIYYTNILNRYCGNQDDNDAVNKMIGEDLKHCADHHDCGGDNKNNSDLCDNGILQMDTSQQMDDNT